MHRGCHRDGHHGALMGEPLARFPHGSSACYYRTLEFTGAVDVRSGEMLIPEELGLLDNTIRVRFGRREKAMFTLRSVCRS